MFMQRTTQREEQVSSAAINLNPPVRAESIDLRVLIGHRTATQASALVESVADTFKAGSVNFIAVLEGQRLLGMCSRQEIAALLGGRYGFSLWARKPIRDHLCQQETRIKVAMPISDVLRTVFARPDANFYDDVLLVNENGEFVGFIATETLFKVQNALLLTNIREIEERDREIRHKNEQMETDLRMATELQQALMPSTYPNIPANAQAGESTLRFCHRYLPATLMGGDFFHIAQLNDDTAAICICDVMGHGVRAALITAMMRAMIESHAAEALDPGGLLTHLNGEFTRILKQTGTLVFVTFLYCVINIRAGTAGLARAGHPAPLHVRRSSGDVEPIGIAEHSAGPAIGIIPNAQFKTMEAKFIPGDFLLFYTDGIIEVEASDGSQFGLEGLRQSIRSNLDCRSESLLDHIISDVYEFADSTVLVDDACLVTAELSTRLNDSD
jgi:serine phosphatase RsbU (regulator of sigma subunit)